MNGSSMDEKPKRAQHPVGLIGDGARLHPLLVLSAFSNFGPKNSRL